MKIEQVINFLVYDDNDVKLYERTDSTSFTVTNYSIIVLTIPKNTTDQEVVFPISDVKIVFIDTPIDIKFKIDNTGADQYSITNSYVLNSKTSLTKLYFTNESTTADVTLTLLVGSAT